VEYARASRDVGSVDAAASAEPAPGPHFWNCSAAAEPSANATRAAIRARVSQLPKVHDCRVGILSFHHHHERFLAPLTSRRASGEAMSPSSSSLFEILPQRPPTPPRDVSRAVEDAISFLDDSNEIENALKGSRSKHTTPTSRPSTSPPSNQFQRSSQEAPGGSNGGKKVGFTPTLTTLHSIPRPGQSSSPGFQLRKSVPSTKDARPLKSILKQSQPLTPDDIETKLSFFSPQEPGSFAKMLQSVIHQLAGASVSSRLDAYMALNGTLKTYDDVPDAQAMIAKMSLLMQFMTRDMVWKNSDGTLHTNIITQALKLTAAILYDMKLAASLDDDFRAFVVERSVAALEQTDMPKPLIKLHLLLLAQQTFSASIITAGRSDKILTALRTIEERCSGTNAVVTRLAIYQKLLGQARPIMLTRMREWIEHAFHGALSSVKEVRTRAIDLCTHAGLLLGVQAQASRAIMDLFECEKEDGKSYGDYLGFRLMQMVSDKEARSNVPQIWAAVVLYFRNKRYPLDKWSRTKAWLLILQKCMNSSDPATCHQGYLAWNKLVFTIMPDNSTPRGLFDMLSKPQVSRMNDKNSKDVRRIALDSYYNLLHYALRPGLLHEELDRAWDAYITPVLPVMVKNPKGRYHVCNILRGLFSTKSGCWNANAANEPNPIRPEELPKLDARWVRSRLGKILPILVPILKCAMTAAGEPTSTAEATWRALMQSLAEAGSQEVKTSFELKEALALLANEFRVLWDCCTEPSAYLETGVRVKQYVTLLDTTVKAIGPGPFAEDILSKAKDDSMRAVLTPSHRSSKHHSVPQSPFVFLFGLLYNPPSTLEATEGAAPQLLALQLSARSLPSAQIEMLLKSLQTWSTSYMSETDEAIEASLWCSIANATTTLLESPSDEKDNHGSQTLGLELRSAVAILSAGLKRSSVDCVVDAAVKLYRSMFNSAKAGAGQAGAVISVIEPAAKVLLGETVALPAKMRLAEVIIRSTSWPRSRQELEQARKALWGVGLPPHKAAVFDPFEHLYQLVGSTLTESYKHLESLNTDSMANLLELIDAVMDWLKVCPLSLTATALRNVQSGFVSWIEDVDRKTNKDGTVNISAAVRQQPGHLSRDACLTRPQVHATWRELLQLLESLPEKNTMLVKALEPLLVAAFSSPHKAIVNEMIVFWNHSFGQQLSLDYPHRLQSVLRVRLTEADIELPTFPDSHGEAPVSLPSFYESQTGPPAESDVRLSGTSDVDSTSRIPSTAPVVRSKHFQASSLADSTRPASSPITGKSGTDLPPTKARLRHDDSQVEFAPIESSPIHFDDSQMLTERQKEVRNRQQENAQVFAEMSSSPAVKPRPCPRSIQKRLDFTSESARDDEDTHIGTPQELAEAELPMSDDIPSSPTPSTKGFEAAQIDIGDDEIDPPSSPPVQKDDDAIPTKKDVDFFGDNDNGAAAEEEQDELPDVQQPSQNRRPSPLPIEHTFPPSDTSLPNEQLQLEAQEAELEVEKDASVQSPSVNEVLAEDPGEVDISRVENSFVAPAPSAEDEDAEAGSQVSQQSQQSQQGQRSGSKRKRKSTAGQASKKLRKGQSPIQMFFSFLGRNSQQDQEEDIDEEIVVASSQPSGTPVKERTRQIAPSPAKSSAPPSKAVQEKVSATSQESASGSQQQKKRGRGRPRKSTTPAPAPEVVQQPQPKKLKRKASNLSSASAAESDPATSFVKDTPAPAASRAARDGADTRSKKAARLSQKSDTANSQRRDASSLPPERATSRASRRLKETDESQSQRRQVAEVVVPCHSQSEEPVEDEDDEEEVDERVKLNNVQDRPVATPRSILERLRGVLTDLPRMILGLQEERDMDDVLFEIRKEVHDAGRRGREE
jgi:hypothetical protein